MDAPQITKRDQILEVLRDMIQKRRGNSPSGRDLAHECERRGVIGSYSALRVHLMLLEAEGRIGRLDDGTIILIPT